MLKISAIANTLLKKEPLQSQQLKPSQVSPVAKGKTFKATMIRKEGKHTLYDLAYDAGRWWVYNPHWTIGSKTFPSGLPMPQIGDNPSKTQVIEAIVKYCILVGVKNNQHIAYVLSTAENESQFKPIREYRGRTLTRDQQRYWHTGFMGRGMIQLTWRSNYVRVGKNLGIDLVNNPNLLLTYPVAIASLVIGMRDGWYTGKKLTHFKPGDYWNQRAIVNPGEIKYRSYWHRATKFVDSAHKWQAYLEKHANIYPGLTA